MNVCVVGCGHGKLDVIYSTLAEIERQRGVKIELLLICGDFQANRNLEDLSCMACPAKYRSMESFWKYYSGEVRAPVMTIYIGGNHEAVEYHHQLFWGGWVAPNIYYMGNSGVVNYGGLRIAGLSGIYKAHDFHTGYHEFPPFSDSQRRSVYHVRAFDVFKLCQIMRPIDIFLSHDWPQDIALHGDWQRLVRRKPFFEKEIHTHTLGSEPGKRLLHLLQPRFWFSAHLHVKFAAVVNHSSTTADSQSDASSGAASSGKCTEPDRGVEDASTRAPEKCKVTRFLALDKVLPRRDFLQILHFPEATSDRVLCHDEEWLSITRAAHSFMAISKHSSNPLPWDCVRNHADARVADDSQSSAGTRAGTAVSGVYSGVDVEYVRFKIESAERGNVIPTEFHRAAPSYSEGEREVRRRSSHASICYREHPATRAFLAWLDLANPFAEYASMHGTVVREPGHLAQAPLAVAANDDEIDIAGIDSSSSTDMEKTDETAALPAHPSQPVPDTICNSAEIAIDDVDSSSCSD